MEKNVTGSSDGAVPRSQGHFPHVDVTVEDQTLRLFGLDESDHIFATVRATGAVYENALLQFLASFLEGGDLVVDVGANIGNHTAYFAGVLGCEVRAFEAVPILADVLALTVRANLLDSRVRVEPYAVGRRAGVLGVSSWNSANSGATRLGLEGTGSIPVVALDDLDWPEPPRALKIDVEGMELEVLDGALQLIRRHRPLLVVEAVDAEADEAIRAWVSTHGYAVLGVFNATPTLVCAPVTGSVTRTPDEVIYRTLEHLGARIDAMHAHLERLGRYMQRTQTAVESRLAAVDALKMADQEATGAAPDSAVVQTLQQQNADLRAKLDALERSMRATVRENKLEVAPHD